MVGSCSYVFIFETLPCDPHSIYFLSLLSVQLLVRVFQSSSSITFFSTQRKRKLKGSSLIVAPVSLFSFLKATKCIAFHSGRLDVSTVSIVSQLLYGSSRLRSARTPFRDWSVSRNNIADPRSYNIQRQYAIFKAQCFKVFLAPVVFVLFETILFWSFCVHLHNLQKRIQTFEDCI